ncbi:MAG: hypothetical protein KC503_22735 [Myxococcales bacterium]|nr:hypothetical protein [Myxococcales bacterium]
MGAVLLATLSVQGGCTTDNPGMSTTDGARDAAADGASAGDGVSAGTDAPGGGGGDGASASDAAAADAASGRPLGAGCGSAAQCASGFCADGVCCESACGGTCRQCDLATARGRCMPSLAGTQCRAAQCSPQNDGVLQLAHFCNGEGNCEATGDLECKPYGCDAANAKCFTSCSPASAATQCQQGQQCQNNRCGGNNAGLPFGAPCTSAGQCVSGKCSGGVCCDADCNGQCETCNLPGAVGKCVAVPDATAPIDSGKTCPTGSSVCGFDGLCDGRRHCRVAPQGTPCGTATCTDGAERSRLTSQQCNGDRQQPQCESDTNGCGDYRCNAAGTACLQSCSGDAQCRQGRFCVATRCVECRDNNDCGPNQQCGSDGDCHGGN